MSAWCPCATPTPFCVSSAAAAAGLLRLIFFGTKKQSASASTTRANDLMVIGWMRFARALRCSRERRRSDWKRKEKRLGRARFPPKISRRHDEIDDHRLCRFGVENCAFRRVKLSLSLLLAHLPHDGRIVRLDWASLFSHFPMKAKAKEKKYVRKLWLSRRGECLDRYATDVVARRHAKGKKKEKKGKNLLFDLFEYFFWPFLYNQSPPHTHKTLENFFFFFFFVCVAFFWLVYIPILSVLVSARRVSTWSTALPGWSNRQKDRPN